MDFTALHVTITLLSVFSVLSMVCCGLLYRRGNLQDDKITGLVDKTLKMGEDVEELEAKLDSLKGSMSCWN